MQGAGTGSARPTAPVIGITTYVEPVTRGPWEGQLSAVLPFQYVDAVYRAGGLPVLLPPREDIGVDEVDTWLDRLDGLVVSGGADVEASRYGADPHPSVQEARRDRDATELLLVERARARRIPLLGVCRGMQVMAVQAGGTIEQHVPDRVGHDDHSPGPGRFGSHAVTLVDGSRVASIVGSRVEVPTYHHQAVETHPGFVAVGHADDGTLEAMEDPDAPFCLGVQWHPEAGDDLSLFTALIEAARG